MFGCSTHSGYPPLKSSNQTPVAILESQTVALTTLDEDGAIRAYCSGTWVSTDTVLTSRHCVAELKLGGAFHIATRDDVFVKDSVSLRKEIWSRETLLVAVDEDNDLALGRVRNAPKHFFARLSSYAVQSGQSVQAMGQPVGLWWSYSRGDIAAIRMIDSTMYIQSTIPISPGSSGCGLFDNEGALIGVARGSHKRGQNLNIFVHTQHLAAFLKGRTSGALVAP